MKLALSQHLGIQITEKREKITNLRQYQESKLKSKFLDIPN